MSCDLWNSTEINPPLTNTYECIAPDIDFPNVHALLTTGVQTHTVPKVLLVESCVMKKVIYKLKLQLRHDKGFKLFESTSRYLQHFFDLEISKALKYFSLFIPQKNEKVVTLPSRQMLEYVLVRLQGYAQVCARIVETTFKCTNFMKMRLVIGHQWEIALVIIAIASRIWFLCRHFAMKSCFLYNNLLPLLDKLELTGNKWLPDLYKFPTDLKTWLNYDWLIESPNIVGIPKFALDDDFEFMGLYHHTYITDDTDDDDDESNDVKFICNFGNKKIRLNKKQVKHLQSRIIISVDDSDSEEDNLVPSSEYDDIFDLLDDDIQIKDSLNPKSMDDDTVAIDVKIDENKNVELENNESNDGTKIMEDPVEDQHDTGEPDDEFVIISDSEEKNEVNVPEGDDDIGEPITRHEIEKEQDETEEEIDEQEEMEIEYNEEENEEEEVKYSEEEMEEIKKPIKIFEKLVNIDTIKKIKSLLQSENLHRKTNTHELCLFVHIPDNLWYHIVFHIKYFIAMTIGNSPNRNKYLIKSKNLLSSITLENTSLDYMPTSKIKSEAVDDPAPMTLKGKEYLINSIDSLSDLQVLIAKDIHKRTKSVEKSLFSNFNCEEWTQICTKIKYLIVMGIKKPIRSKDYLKKAKAKLRQLVIGKKYVNDNINVEKLKPDNFDNIYKSLTQEESYSQLFKYIQDIEDYVYPPKMINALKEKIGGHSLKTRNYSQSPKKNEDHPEEQPTRLGGNTTQTITHTNIFNLAQKQTQLQKVFSTTCVPLNHTLSPHSIKNC